jgi:hypothetical protein
LSIVILVASFVDNDCDKDGAYGRPKATWRRYHQQHLHDSVATACLTGASPASPKNSQTFANFFVLESQLALPVAALTDAIVATP